MAGRFPGAQRPRAFWQQPARRRGVDRTLFTDAELDAAGVPPALLRATRATSARGGVLEDADRFDAAFFGYTPREAELMDPQQRLFLECAWEALEDAGYDRGRMAAAPSASSPARARNTLPALTPARAAGPAGQLGQLSGWSSATSKDFLTTRVVLQAGPARAERSTVQTACSTSLVAVHLACQSLLDRRVRHGAGRRRLRRASRTARRLPLPGGRDPLARRPLPRLRRAGAQGTVSGSGVGVVVLKRLADALADGDTIHAVIRGSAINNDGARKVGYTAPSVEGQAEVIAEALGGGRRGRPTTIGYVEAHGTGTPLGDPIEVAALTQAFRRRTAAARALRARLGQDATSATWTRRPASPA